MCVINSNAESLNKHSCYLPHFTIKKNIWNTELTLVNTANSVQNITIKLYSSEGKLHESSQITLGASSGLHRSINEVFQGIVIDSGWLQIIPEIEASVAGIVTFTYLPTEAKTSLPLVDDTSSELVFPLIENNDRFNSGLAVVNLSEYYQEIYIRASDLSSNTVGIQSRWLAPFEKVSVMTTELFSDNLPEHTITTITGKTDLAGFALTFSKEMDSIVSIPARAILHGTTNRNQFAQTGNYEGEYWPDSSWRTCRPENVGVNSEKLVIAYDYLANNQLNSKGVVIVKDGYIVGEAYFNNFSQNSLHRSFSVAKSITSAAMGIAIDKKFISSVHQKAHDFFPEWNDEVGRKKRMTIQHILTMTSGLQWNEEEYSTDTENDDVRKMVNSRNYLEYILSKDSIHEPGTVWNYSSGDSMLLSGIIQRATDIKLCEFAEKHLFKPVGMDLVLWDYDSAGNTVGGWGIHTTARNFARFGYLYLKRGKWGDNQIIPENWVEESTSPSLTNIYYYGYQWWLPNAWYDVGNFTIPESTFIAIGIYRQYIYVVPEHNLVVVRLGDDYGYDIPWHTLEFLQLIVDSIESP
ncbi:MAG: hypothetical protein CR997_01870 [Acidobacteria bacterium]|nr:MAG: hypothetical protein CR997_01870 [Acidobacteriota bacterium]